jgi:DNA topoisomerase I
MNSVLVIVESPGKIKKIEEYLNLLGDFKYIVKASYGHCRDLDPKSLSIDIDNNFAPNYKIIAGKEKTVKELRALKKDCKKVIIASDEDREGEMIAESIKDILGLKNPERIVFHEITQKAIHEAVKNPKTINVDMVNAQQARRLFDRLVGYKISPLLWKKIAGMSSAGRVQSVVVKIIVDKEKEIEDSISSPYFKTTAKFIHDKNKFNGVLQKGKELFKFESEKESEDFLNSIHVDDKFKVKSCDTKETKRKPSPPFITSTMQQEASTKLGFGVKRTMDAAQKLYESGMITYMRTDSTNLSEDAISECKKLIEKTYGKEYSNPKNYNKNSAGAQEAHEAVRPTNISTESTGGRISADAEKLYKLIRNRTLASQMADAIVDVQTIKIDVINKDKKSRLPKGTLFHSTFENIKFSGFLILYNDKNDDSTESETMEGKIEIKEGTKVKNKEINISEEYSKLPLRYNEAGLVKYLEKNGIGRPSTYASIISKVIERQYVEIKNIDGTRKKSVQINLKNSKSEIFVSKKTKDIVIGKESKKLVCTDTGIRVNDFLVENFDSIMKLDFTANFEKYLDKVAEGTATWYNVLEKFYGMFSTIVEEIEKKIKDEPAGNTDASIGVDDQGREIFKGKGNYGPYVKLHDGEKWKFAPNKKGEKVKLEEAIELLKFPMVLGKIGKDELILNKGQYGYYLKCGSKKMSVKDSSKNDSNIDFGYAKGLIESGDAFAVKSFKLKGKILNVKKGPYGFYIQIVTEDSKKKPTNIGLPKDIDEDFINELTLEKVISIVGVK